MLVDPPDLLELERQLLAPGEAGDLVLDGVLGLESLRGVSMPWSDVVASAGALAGALGIVVEAG